MITISELADILNRKEGMVIRMMRNRGYLKKNDDPKKWCVDEGYMRADGMITKKGERTLIEVLGIKASHEDEYDEEEDDEEEDFSGEYDDDESEESEYDDDGGEEEDFSDEYDDDENEESEYDEDDDESLDDDEDEYDDDYGDEEDAPYRVPDDEDDKAPNKIKLKGRIVDFRSEKMQLIMQGIKGRRGQRYENKPDRKGYVNGAGAFCYYPVSYLFMKVVLYTDHGNETKSIDIRDYVKQQTGGKRITQKYIEQLKDNNCGKKTFFYLNKDDDSCELADYSILML